MSIINSKEITTEGNAIFFEHKCNDFAELVYSNGTKVTYEKKHVIVSPGDQLDSFYYIDSGRVKYTLTNSEGIEKVLIILEKSAFFGEGPLITGLPSTISAVADTVTTVYKISHPKFQHLIATSDLFRSIILKSAYTKMNIIVNEVERLSFATCKERLLNLLDALANKEILIDDSWYKLKSKYTQQELANIVGASRVTVANLNSQLCDEGFIRIINRELQVKKISG